MYSTNISLTDGLNHLHKNGLSNGHSNLEVGASVVAVKLPQGGSIDKIDADPILASTQQQDVGQIIYSSEYSKPVSDICPSCGANAFVYEEGCSKCHVCGYSEC